MVETFLQDLRYGARMLKTKPGFTLAAVIALALGIGANTAIFSVMMTVLVRPLPVQEPEALVYLWSKNQALGVSRGELTGGDILDLRERAANGLTNSCCAQVTGWTILGVNVKGAKPERVEGMLVNTNFFQTLGAQPLLGRAFVKGDEEGAIISYGLWQRQFGGDPHLIGQKIGVELIGRPNQILLGVMPPEFDFPLRTDVWLPDDIEPDFGRGGSHYFRAMARLKPGVTVKQAQAELSQITRSLAEQYPETNAGWGISVVSFREYLFGSAHVALPLLLGAVGCVLLIACTNVANLQLARAAARQKEIAVRLALGAGRWRIIRQLLTESLLLALAGGALGLLLAMWVVDMLRAAGPSSIPRLPEVTINAQALWFTLALSILTGVLFGLAPAWPSSNPDLHRTLKDSGHSASASLRGQRFRQALIVSQVALALVLLVGAGWLSKSFWRVRQINLGFETEHVLTAGVSLSWSDYRQGDPRRTAFFQQAIERVRQLPGVASVGAISHLPLGGRGVNMAFEIKGQPRLAAKTEPVAEMRIISPSYFDALRMPLLSGRVLTEHDLTSTPQVIVINESFARGYFAGRHPLGERLKFGDDFFDGAIVGVVGDVRHRGLEADALPEMYISYLQNTMFPVMNFVIRTTSDPASMAASVRRELQAVDPREAVYSVQPMEQLFSASIAQRRFNLLLLAAFAVLAVLLAAAGIYGVISYAVAQRTREIGIRLALGAETKDVLKLVLGQGMMLTLIGVAIGLLAARGLTRLMASLLFGVSATDSATFTLIALSLSVVALLACYLPARRAAKVDPMIALRYE